MSLECTNLNSLISRARKLIDTVGDTKIKTAISLASESLERKDPVLLFSRYTDTIEALLYEYKDTESINKADYNLPKASENPVCHVRPHARNSSDTFSLPDGRQYPKQCFWLNNSYIL